MSKEKKAKVKDIDSGEDSEASFEVVEPDTEKE